MEKVLYDELKHDNYLENSINIEDAKFTLQFDHGLIPGYNVNSRDVNDFLDIHQSRSQILHSHEGYEFFYVKDESINILFDKKEETFERGTIIIIPPKTKHRLIDPWYGRTYSFFFTIEKNNLKTDFSLYSKFAQLFEKDYFSFRTQHNFSNTIDAMDQAESDGNYFMFSYHFHGILAHIITASDESGTITTRVDSTSTRLYKLNLLINSYYTQNISIKEIADELSLSTRQLNRIIQKKYGCKFRTLITSKRMELAANLLLSGEELTILEVSVRSGYNSPKGFYTAFKNHYGCLPNEFKEKNQN